MRRLARRHLRNERVSHTLDPTRLVHETYLRLVGSTPIQYVGAGHFLAIASTAMRRILVEHARAKQRLKRGGDLTRIPLTPATLDAFGATEFERLSRADSELLISVDCPESRFCC